MSIKEGLTFISNKSPKWTFAFCPRGHLHRLNITIPKNTKSFDNVVWPPESLDYFIVHQNTVLVSQLRFIRVQDCPCPLPGSRPLKSALNNPSSMIIVKVHDVYFLAHITNSVVDYMSDALYNFLRSRKPFAFHENKVNLPRYVDSVGNPVNVQQQAIITFEITTNRETRKQDHPIYVIRVKDEITAVCVLGSQFLKKFDDAILTVDRILIGGPESKEYVSFLKHKYGRQSHVTSIYPVM